VLTTECKKKPQKDTQGNKITHMGERRRRRKSSKEIKETLTSKQNANVNPMGSLVLCTQHKGICCCRNMKDSLELLLVILKLIFLLSIPNLVK
jgi:hypothetical protein